jgi:hypothetical protein
MSWSKLPADHRVTALPASKAELDNLRSIVARSLRDVESAGLSADARFVMAYDGARILSLLIVRASGYRPRSVGAHYNTFLALEVADPTFAKLSAYFDGCRIKRNSCEYDFAGRRGSACGCAAVCSRCGSMDQIGLPASGLNSGLTESDISN